MDMRELKALEIAARSKVEFVNDHWLVPSQSTGSKYRVSIGAEPFCECEDWLLRRQADKPCKHILAARIVCERDHGGKGPVVKTDAVPKKPTHKQNWPAYNEAQTTEKNRFQILLADLCGCLEEPKRKTGRTPVALADRAFSVIFKAWSTLSSRRFDCDLKEAHERGHLSRPLHPNKINCFLEAPALTPHLKALVVRSALPLRAIETEFAVDSSGFTSSKFVRWYDHKYGKTREEHDWVKVHIVCGVNTHVVTAAAIYGRDAHDSPIMPELVDTTKENFTIKEMSADKGYLSVENVEKVFAAGGIPFIAPKINTTGAAGGLFEKMFHYYEFQREEFLQHYHKRSNIESTFSAVKRKFGDAVRSRKDEAMVNEVLAKLICNNLWCVILSQCELGIEAVFWKDEDDKGDSQSEGPAILPFRAG